MKIRLSLANCCLVKHLMIEWYELIVHDWIKATDKDNALLVIQLSDFIGCKQFFATLSSDEFKKTAAAKKNLCGCRSNWRLEAKKSPVVPGK